MTDGVPDLMPSFMLLPHMQDDLLPSCPYLADFPVYPLCPAPEHPALLQPSSLLAEFPAYPLCPATEHPALLQPSSLL